MDSTESPWADVVRTIRSRTEPDVEPPNPRRHHVPAEGHEVAPPRQSPWSGVLEGLREGKGR